MTMIGRYFEEWLLIGVCIFLVLSNCIGRTSDLFEHAEILELPTFIRFSMH